MTKENKQAVKRHLNSLKKNAINRSYKSKIKFCVKQLILSLEKEDNHTQLQLLSKVQSSLDKAVKNNVIHLNKASRIKRILSFKVKQQSLSRAVS
jgi:small subunit ribosomal protein S20